MRRSITIAVVVSTLLMATALTVQAETGSVNGRRNLTRALQGAWLPLESGLAVSVREGTPLSANAGYRAVSAMPSLDTGHPIAEVTLVHGDDWKVVIERLD